nr:MULTISPECIES: preprotein translocase subunit SecE [Geothrix]
MFAELDRVDWPSKEKVLTSTYTVVIISVFVGAYLWAADWVFSKGFAYFFLKTR